MYNYTIMGLYRIFLITGVIVFSCLDLNAQDTKKLKLINTKLEFPYKNLDHQIVVAAPTAYYFDKIADNYHFDIFLTSIFPNDKYLFYDSIIWPYKWHAVLEVNSQGQLFTLSSDANNDEKIQENERWTGNLKKPLYVDATFASEDTTWSPRIPLQIEVVHENGKYGLKVTSLQSLTLDCTIDSIDLRVEFIISNWLINFKLYALSLITNDKEFQNFVLEEPFKLNDSWYYFSNLDIKNETVDLHRFAGETIYGFRQGYFVPLEYIQKLTVSCNLDSQKYSLLHFWGPWCFPCVEELPFYQNLSRNLSEYGKTNIVSYSLLFSQYDKAKLTRLTLEYPQYGCQEEIYHEKSNFSPGKNGDGIHHAIDLLHVFEYPEYIVLDPKGKIIYRGGNNKESLIKALKQLKLI